MQVLICISHMCAIIFSGNGEDVLVSYCTDYVYLFTTNERSAKKLSTEAVDAEAGYSGGSESADIPPMKRLRLRGDWSDTGPQGS